MKELADGAGRGFTMRHLCQATPKLRPDQWLEVSGRLRRDMYALQVWTRELLLPFGTVASVPSALLASLHQVL